MSEAAAEPSNCLNCNAELTGEYCANCGQPKESYRRTVWALFEELFEHLFSFDSRAWRAIWTLISQPGELSAAYRDGQRARYTPPLKFYLFTSLAMFITLAVSGLAVMQFEPQPAGMADDEQTFVLENFKARIITFEPVRERTHRLTRDQVAALNTTLDYSEDQTLYDQWKTGIARAALDPADLNENMQEWVPRVLFVLVPAMALLLALFFRRKKVLLFVDHLVMAMHLHTFLFLVIIPLIVLSTVVPGWILLTLLLLIMSVYLILALKRFYAQSWPRTLWKGVLVGLLYYFLFVVPGLIIVLVVSVMNA